MVWRSGCPVASGHPDPAGSAESKAVPFRHAGWSQLQPGQPEPMGPWAAAQGERNRLERQVAPECLLQMVPGLFLLMMNSYSISLLLLTIVLFVTFSYFLLSCCISYNLKCKLQKHWFTPALCTLQSCSSTALASEHSWINSNNARETQEETAERYFQVMYSQYSSILQLGKD